MNYTTTNFVAQRNQYAYIRVCNVNAEGPKDTAKCSESASTKIQIDGTPPVVTVNTTPTCSRQNGIVYTKVSYNIEDPPLNKEKNVGSPSGLKSYHNKRTDNDSIADDYCSREDGPNDIFTCKIIFKDATTKIIKSQNDHAPVPANHFNNSSTAWGTSSKNMFLNVTSMMTCDFAGNCTSKIIDKNGTVYENGVLTHNTNTGFMSCEKWSETH